MEKYICKAEKNVSLKAVHMYLLANARALPPPPQRATTIPMVRGGGRVVQWCWVNFQCRGVLLIWIRVGQGPTALAVGAGGGSLDIFSLVYHFSFLLPLSLSLGDGPI